MNLMVRKKEFSLFLLFSLIVILVNNSNFIEVIGFSFSILLAGVSVLGIAFSFVYIINKKIISKDLIPVVNHFLIFAVAVFLMSFHGPSKVLGLQRAFQILSVLGVFYLFYSGGLKGRAPVVFNGVRKLIIIAFVIHFLLSLVGIKVTAFSEYSGLLLNPNGFGMWVAVLSLLVLSARPDNKYSNILFFIVSLYLVFISGSRTSLLALLVGVLIISMPYRVIKSKFFKLAFVFGLFLLSFLIVYSTVYMDLSSYNEAVKETSGKNLQSGRHLIWPAVMESVWIKPWFGWGSGAGLNDIFDRTFSVHNAYLQTLMQNGFLGLLLMLSIILKIYFVIYKAVGSQYFKLALAMLSALIMINNFEITMFQNNLALSYPVWAACGLAFGHYHYHRKTSAL